MNANEIMKAIESKITDKEVNDMIQTYKRIIRDYLISGNDDQAKRYSEKLAVIYTKFQKVA